MLKEITKFVEDNTSFVIGIDLLEGHWDQDQRVPCILVSEFPGGKVYGDLDDRIDFYTKITSRAKTYFTARDNVYTVYHALHRRCLRYLFPAIESGTNLVTNGSLESWSSLTNADDWSETAPGASSIERTTTKKYGTYGAKLSQGAVAALILFESNVNVSLLASNQYQLTFWYKNTGAVPCMRWFFADIGTNVMLSTDGTWVVPGYNNLDSVNIWTKEVIDFVPHPSYANYEIQFRNIAAANTNFYLDEVSVKQAVYEMMAATAINSPQYLGQDAKGNYLFECSFNLKNKTYVPKTT